MSTSNVTSDGQTSTKAIRLLKLQKEGIQEPQTECEQKCNALVESFVHRGGGLKERLAFLRPQNELGVEKFVSTFIQPTLLPYPDLYDVNHCATFVARYVTCEPLGEIDCLDISIVSPARVLGTGVGDCIDCSFLLASLLLGVGCDAYVVIGNAPSWIRRIEKNHMRCDDDGLFVSDECYHKTKSFDDGVGVHCWVLVKAGRYCDSSCFVEPSTGVLYPVQDSPYQQVFLVCNAKNCWVNTTKAGANPLELDFTETNQWNQVLPDAHPAPFSWGKPLMLPKEMYDLRYQPNGKRVLILDKTKVELFGVGVDPQGCKSRVIRYEDEAQTVVVECVEQFYPEARSGHLTRRTRRPLENSISELYTGDDTFCQRSEVVGKLLSLKFNAKSRHDDLIERIEDLETSTITELFADEQRDGLARRKIHYQLQSKGEKSKKLAESLNIGINTASITRIDECYQAPSGSSELENAVARRSFDLKDRSIAVTYHSKHAVLQKERMYSEEEIANTQDGKQLLSLQNASISAVRKIHAEMIRLNKAKYREETKAVVVDTSKHGSKSSPEKIVDVGSRSGNDVDFDYLSPYLPATGGTLSKEDAIRVKTACLKDAKERLLQRSLLIQSRLKQCRESFACAEDCSDDASLRIKLLEARLTEHEEKATAKYQELEQRLDNDSRLASLKL